jgi:hypothetical protein
MIRCPICSTENDDFAITCTHCKGFLQNRVPNLNFFETAWGVLESPRKTFRRIALAEHKNYALVLFSLFGISLTFTLMWYFNLGERFNTLLDLIITALLLGPGVGLVSCLLFLLPYVLFARIMGGKAAVRASLGVLAYALTPIVLSLFLVLPIELLTFGMYFFTSNPHPYVLKPVSYVMLIGFDVVVTVWTIFLVLLGSMVVQGLSFIRSIVTVALTLASVCGLFLLVVQRIAGSSIV